MKKKITNWMRIDLPREYLNSSSKNEIPGWSSEIDEVTAAMKRKENHTVSNTPASGNVPITCGMVINPRLNVPDAAMDRA